MAVRPIILSPDPTLRERSHYVRRVDAETQQLIDDMIETMRAANGIGLAAIQIGVPRRVIVVEVPQEPEPEAEGNDESEEVAPVPTELYVVINPKLARVSRDVEEGIEGCLSIPGWVGQVSRHRAVTVKGLDYQGKPVRIKAEGLLARVFQHEIDHCHGVLFTDHIADAEKLWPVPEGEEE
ncbi:MAG: peptide deformylase, partial [Chloroflexi bacterium]